MPRTLGLPPAPGEARGTPKSCVLLFVCIVLPFVNPYGPYNGLITAQPSQVRKISWSYFSDTLFFTVFRSAIAARSHEELAGIETNRLLNVSPKARRA